MKSVHCLHCNSEFDIPKSNPKKKFCNSACAASYNNKLRAPRSEESKAKTSKALKDISFKPIVLYGVNHPNWKGGKSKQITVCPVCSKIFQKRGKQKSCSVECGNKILSEWVSKNRKHIIGRREPSWMERTFAEWLHAQGLSKGIHGFLTEVKFRNHQTGKYGWCDFVFPKKRLIIELDGTHHIKRVHLDTIRDQHLKCRGWNVFRVSYEEYKKGSKIEEIKKLLN
jgi:very-short-patch-repair endonuclease